MCSATSHDSTQAESSSRAMAGVILSKMSGVIASSLGAGRTAPCRLLVPQHGQGLVDRPYARLGPLRALDSEHVLPLAAAGQAVAGGEGGRIGVQGAGEVRGLGHNTRLGIEFHLDLDLVAGHDTGGFSVGVAEAEQVTAPHDGYPARRDADVNGEGTAPAAHQLDGPRRNGELDILAAKARRHGEAAVNVAPLVRYSA
jgi:hypothetical protein